MPTGKLDSSMQSTCLFFKVCHQLRIYYATKTGSRFYTEDRMSQSQEEEEGADWAGVGWG